ncbi:universal stress protein [Methanobrevibacter olleyae]|uniref:Nucleotide-binding universal stress protein, UspA family n=1 Tax=Methanobrevibacter olleyae TaxID=294671 RepID=A0A126QZ64_METOL|nr:universal stress protein [Methanobrevibacter olleyae]AMK14675.1 universal stress protein UspA [Methanobrevibacter olleyae]SFL54809.1 Nucleotide-binding universal stress protein, UspA family [Methanobrevibacter olleyae]
MYKKILLPTDGSEYSVREIERATKLLAEDGEIIILSVAMELRKTAFQRSKDIDKANKEALKEANDNVKAMKEGFDDSVNVKTKVVVGFPAESINEVAEEEGCDLIIIASSGKSGLKKFVIGSVAERVLKDSEKDVLLIHN